MLFSFFLGIRCWGLIGQFSYFLYWFLLLFCIWILNIGLPSPLFSFKDWFIVFYSGGYDVTFLSLLLLRRYNPFWILLRPIWLHVWFFLIILSPYMYLCCLIRRILFNRNGRRNKDVWLNLCFFRLLALSLNFLTLIRSLIFEFNLFLLLYYLGCFRILRLLYFIFWFPRTRLLLWSVHTLYFAIICICWILILLSTLIFFRFLAAWDINELTCFVGNIFLNLNGFRFVHLWLFGITN